MPPWNYVQRIFDFVSSHWPWVVAVGGVVGAAIGFYEKFLNIKKTRLEIKKTEEQQKIQDVAEKLLREIKPSHKEGNKFHENHLADRIKEDLQITRKALFYLQGKNLAHKQDSGWWMLEPRNANPSIWKAPWSG